jgi:hypothetical protein
MGDVAVWYVGGCLMLFATGWAAGMIHQSIIRMADAL